jgi:hypothetical protein
MKRLLIVLAAVAAISLTALAPTASANHTLGHRVNVLEGKVATLQSKMNCLGKMPVTSFADYAWYEGDPGFPNVALWWTYGTGAPADAHVIAVKRTDSCRAKFPTLSSPLESSFAARAAGEIESIYSVKTALQ